MPAPSTATEKELRACAPSVNLVYCEGIPSPTLLDAVVHARLGRALGDALVVVVDVGGPLAAMSTLAATAPPAHTGQALTRRPTPDAEALAAAAAAWLARSTAMPAPPPMADVMLNLLDDEAWGALRARYASGAASPDEAPVIVDQVRREAVRRWAGPANQRLVDKAVVHLREAGVCDAAGVVVVLGARTVRLCLGGAWVQPRTADPLVDLATRMRQLPTAQARFRWMATADGVWADMLDAAARARAADPAARPAIPAATDRDRWRPYPPPPPVRRPAMGAPRPLEALLFTAEGDAELWALAGATAAHARQPYETRLWAYGLGAAREAAGCLVDSATDFVAVHDPDTRMPLWLLRDLVRACVPELAVARRQRGASTSLWLRPQTAPSRTSQVLPGGPCPEDTNPDPPVDYGAHDDPSGDQAWVWRLVEARAEGALRRIPPGPFRDTAFLRELKARLASDSFAQDDWDGLLADNRPDLPEGQVWTRAEGAALHANSQRGVARALAAALLRQRASTHTALPEERDKHMARRGLSALLLPILARSLCVWAPEHLETLELRAAALAARTAALFYALGLDPTPA